MIFFCAAKNVQGIPSLYSILLAGKFPNMRVIWNFIMTPWQDPVDNDVRSNWDHVWVDKKCSPR